MSTKPKLEEGYYWVHLNFRVTVNDNYDGWDILLYNPREDVWLECGSEIEIGPSFIVEIDTNRLQRS